GALLGTLIAAGVCPLAQAGLDEAFGFAVGTWGIGPGPEMAQAQPANQATEASGAVADTVVGHDARNADAQAPVVTQRLQQSPAGAGATLIGMQGAERYAAGIIDGTWTNSQPVPRDFCWRSP